MKHSQATGLGAVVMLGVASGAATLAGFGGWAGSWFARFGCFTLAALLAQVPWIWSWRRLRATLADRSNQLLAAEQILKASQRQNAEFVAAASHEMNTPLAGIKAYVELLADGDAEDEATREEFLRVINGQADRLQRLIENLLNGRLMVESELGLGSTFRVTPAGSEATS
jgi:signal transduction histidine kinase